MRRVPTQKATPKEVKLKLIKSEIDSSLTILDSLKKENKTVVDDISDGKKILNGIEDNTEEAKKEFNAFKKLVTIRLQELSVLDKKISDFKDIINENEDLIKSMNGKAEFELKEIEDKIESLNSAFIESVDEYGDTLNGLEKEQEEADKKINETLQEDAKVDSDIKGKTRALELMDEVMLENQDKIGFLKSQIEDYTGSITDVRLELTGLEESKLEMMGELKDLEKDLSVVEGKKDDLEKESVEIKEKNLLLIKREELLDAREEKIKELYKKAGINL